MNNIRNRYIFNKEVSNFINREEATKDLFQTCLSYLSSEILSTDLEDEEIQEYILTGQYRLFDYAMFYWPALILSLAGRRNVVKDLKPLLKQLAQSRRQKKKLGKDRDSKHNSHDSPQPLARFKYFQKDAPEFYDMISEAIEFHSHPKRWDWNCSNSRHSSHLLTRLSSNISQKTGSISIP